MKNFKKYYIIPSDPENLYRALTTEHTILLWTGENASMQAIEGTEFSLWDGSIVGKNLKFEENKSITQQWYFGELSEASIVNIKLHPHKDGTSMEVRQTNIPDEDYRDIVEGWDQVYIASLIDFYQED